MNHSRFPQLILPSVFVVLLTIVVSCGPTPTPQVVIVTEVVIEKVFVTMEAPTRIVYVTATPAPTPSPRPTLSPTPTNEPPTTVKTLYPIAFEFPMKGTVFQDLIPGGVTVDFVIGITEGFISSRDLHDTKGIEIAREDAITETLRLVVYGVWQGWKLDDISSRESVSFEGWLAEYVAKDQGRVKVFAVNTSGGDVDLHKLAPFEWGIYLDGTQRKLELEIVLATQLDGTLPVRWNNVAASFLQEGERLTIVHAHPMGRPSYASEEDRKVSEDLDIAQLIENAFVNLWQEDDIFLGKSHHYAGGSYDWWGGGVGTQYGQKQAKPGFWELENPDFSEKGFLVKWSAPFFRWIRD